MTREWLQAHGRFQAERCDPGRRSGRLQSCFLEQFILRHAWNPGDNKLNSRYGLTPERAEKQVGTGS